MATGFRSYLTGTVGIVLFSMLALMFASSYIGQTNPASPVYSSYCVYNRRDCPRVPKEPTVIARPRLRPYRVVDPEGRAEAISN